MGFPKAGSTSMYEAFRRAKFTASHWTCDARNKLLCGECMKDAKVKGIPLLESCGNFTVFTQMDYMDNNETCIWPQIEYLDDLYKEAPDAMWLLPMRNVTDWIKSVNKWIDMRKRFQICNFPHINFEGIDSESDETMKLFYCNHVKQIRHFVREHPSLTLFEFHIGDPDVGDRLSTMIPSFKASYWGQANVNPIKPLLWRWWWWWLPQCDCWLIWTLLRYTQMHASPPTII